MRIVIFGAGLMIMMSSVSIAHADWLGSDQAVIEDAGFTHGMAEYCNLNTTALMTQASLYIGRHTVSDGDARNAGQKYRQKANEGRKKMSGLTDAMPCSLVREFVRGKVNRLMQANSSGTKIR